MLSTDLLIVTDVQHDFLPGGALAVANGHEILGPINRIAGLFRHVILTQDWHPPGHLSFASSHHGRRPFETMKAPYGQQILWPDHCVQGTFGAEISRDLHIPHAELIIRKGYEPGIDSYSAFIEADRSTKTGLTGYLRERGFRRIFVAGLATDFCVGWTALDAQAAGFETLLIADASRAIDTNGSLDVIRTDLAAAGVAVIDSSNLDDQN
ncbi:nicotinamidase [Microvirga antarctica]|uniref:nicotinamidase n=1 Tax=Microvirga antarctica TaxID=2819233 RepID=UPI001B303B06|nr:nicotinamidase [Microvirga antarctica]